METIPFMHDPALREQYARYLTEQLGDSRLRVTPSTRVVGLLISNGGSKTFDGILRAYVLGSNTSHVERRGIGAILERAPSKAEDILVGERKYARFDEPHDNHIFKSLDTTEQVLEELRAFERAVYS